MSDSEAPQPKKQADVNDVVGSANEGLDAAAAASADVPGSAPRTHAGSPVDADLAAFEEAERNHPGTFSRTDAAAADAEAGRASSDPTPTVAVAPATPVNDQPAQSDADRDRLDFARSEDARTDAGRTDFARTADARADADRTAEGRTEPEWKADRTDAGYAPYTPPAAREDETRIIPAEPSVAPAPQPIFVQAPEPPRERGNRGTAGAVGLLATLAFAILYLATGLGLGALAGDVSAENIGESALAPLTTAGFWVPVVVFFFGFWFLGALINRGRWGLWVVFGILVGLAAYAGHILGQLFEAPFWTLSARESSGLVGEQLLAPLAIAAFVFARELTIWFGAWVARSGARKTELNAESQREYERTLEAGPTLSR